MFTSLDFTGPEGRQIYAVMWSKNYRLQNIQLSKNLRKLLSAFALSRYGGTAFAFLVSGSPSRSASRLALSSQTLAPRRLVENTGIEPVTSWLQTRRSPS